MQRAMFDSETERVMAKVRRQDLIMTTISLVMSLGAIVLLAGLGFFVMIGAHL